MKSQEQLSDPRFHVLPWIRKPDFFSQHLEVAFFEKIQLTRTPFDFMTLTGFSENGPICSAAKMDFIHMVNPVKNITECFGRRCSAGTTGVDQSSIDIEE